MKLSNQAIGALMMALQKCLMEETDIVPLLKDTVWVTNEDGELVVTNPPVISLSEVETTTSVSEFIEETLEEDEEA